MVVELVSLGIPTVCSHLNVPSIPNDRLAMKDEGGLGRTRAGLYVNQWVSCAGRPPTVMRASGRVVTMDIQTHCRGLALA